MDKEQREGLRRKISDHGGTARVGKKEGLRSAELLELLDMADERDQLRNLLEEAKPNLVLLYENDKVRALCERIDAFTGGQS